MRYAVALAAVLSASPVLAQDQTAPWPKAGEQRPRLEVSTGADFERGDFGTQSHIEKTTLPLTMRIASGRARASAQLSWVRVTAPANVIAPAGPLGLPILVDPTRPSSVNTRQGFGDLRVDAAYDLPTRGLFASVRTGAKLPTASADKGLGTAKADYWLGADIAKSIGAVTPFAGVTYTIVGDPKGFDLRNSFSAQAGAAIRLGNTATAQLGYAYAQSPVVPREGDQRIIGGLNAGVSKGLSLGVYGSGGLSDGAPDVGGGVTLGLRLSP